MNLFKFPNFEVLIDYAHNAHGMRAIGEFLEATEATCKVGIFTGVGDRRDEDIIEIGEVGAELFDQIIIRHDEDMRGREHDAVYELLQQGIRNIDPEKEVIYIPEEMRAIAYALEHAEKGSIITILAEDIPEAIKMVENFRVIQDRRVMVD